MLLRDERLEEGSRACQVRGQVILQGTIRDRILSCLDSTRCRLPPKQNPIVQEYCLPDFTPLNPRGYIKSGPNAVPPLERAEGTAATGEEHVVNMGNERFSVPEVLFHPNDIGGSP